MAELTSRDDGRSTAAPPRADGTAAPRTAAAAPPRVDWDARYASPKLCYGEKPSSRVAAAVDRLPRPPARALCLGEGECRNACYLASLGYDCVAVDVSEAGLAKGRALAKRKGVAVATIVADAASALADDALGRFDAVLEARRRRGRSDEARAVFFRVPVGPTEATVSRRRRGRDVDGPRTGRGGAAGETWMVRGRVAATPRLGPG